MDKLIYLSYLEVQNNLLREENCAVQVPSFQVTWIKWDVTGVFV